MSLKRSGYSIPLFRIHATLEDHQTVTAKSLIGQDFMQPTVRGSEFREENDTGSVPTPARFEVTL
jgi:hypothetical protein